MAPDSCSEATCFLADEQKLKLINNNVIPLDWHTQLIRTSIELRLNVICYSHNKNSRPSILLIFLSFHLKNDKVRE